MPSAGSTRNFVLLLLGYTRSLPLLEHKTLYYAVTSLVMTFWRLSYLQNNDFLHVLLKEFCPRVKEKDILGIKVFFIEKVPY